MAQIRRMDRQTSETEDSELTDIEKMAEEAVREHIETSPEPKPKTLPGEKKAASEDNGKWRKAFVVVAVVLASLVMILSILLPSLSAVIEAISSANSEAATTEASTEDSESSEEDALNEYIETIDERYSVPADTLKAKVEADATDKASIINLANTYYEWASSVSNFASSDEQNAHVTELAQNALTYYDLYLSLEDSNAAHVNRALAQYLAGDIAGAQAYLEDFCASVTDYAPAWSNLGMIYNATGETDLALAAYNKVLEVDPDDTYGLKENAETQISTLASTAETEDAAESE